MSINTASNFVRDIDQLSYTPWNKNLLNYTQEKLLVCPGKYKEALQNSHLPLNFGHTKPEDS